MAPLLSICLPTYNRARLLEDALNSLVPQVAAAGDEVELVISDNCSTDDTAAVVERARRLGPFRYYRNESNLGAGRNFLRLTHELAAGEFAWFQCDDDMTCPGGVQRVLTVLKSHRDLDFVFVNVAPRNESSRQSIRDSIAAGQTPPLHPAKCRDKVSRPLARFEELVDPDFDEVFLGSVMCLAFRISKWKTFRPQIARNEDNLLTLNDLYPQSVILAHTMVHSKAYYLAEPCTFAFWGAQQWSRNVPFILAVLLHEMLDEYERGGVTSARIAKCRRRLLLSSGRAIRLLVFDATTPGRELFSLRDFFWRHRRHAATLTLLPGAMAISFFVDKIPRSWKSWVKKVLNACKTRFRVA